MGLAPTWTRRHQKAQALLVFTGRFATSQWAENHIWSLSRVGFILVFIRGWLEENVTNQHFSAAGSGSKECGKSKEQGAHGLRKDR